MISGRTKRGSVVTENPKGASLKTLERFRGETTEICLENEGIGGGGGGGGIAKVIKSHQKSDHSSRETVNTGNISGMLLCCKKKANEA